MPKYFLLYFNDENNYGVCPVSYLKAGLAAEGQRVLVYWSKDFPNVEAKVVQLSGKSMIHCIVVLTPLQAHSAVL